MQIYDAVEEIKKQNDAVISILKEKKVITNPSEIILDNADVLQLLKISQRTLAGWRAKGIITYSKIEGKLYYTQADIMECLNRNKYEKIKN